MSGVDERASAMRQKVEDARVGRLATVTPSGAPHVVPFCFAFMVDAIVTAIDAKPKSTLELARLSNIAAHPEVSMVVDHYDDDWNQLWWVRIDGVASVVDAGPIRETALDLLAVKYPQYVDQRPPGAVIAITPTVWRGWP